MEQSYVPLLKLIHAFKNAKLTLNIPLSLLEQMDRFGYRDWVASIKELYDQGRIELVGSGAYHPLLSKLHRNFMENQIMLNEYGLGYYLGQHKGFEGEACTMIRDIRGFFPPEMAISSDVLSTLDGLGYDWVLVDEFAIASKSLVKGVTFQQNQCKTKLVSRDRALSNLFAFNRGFEHANIIEELTKSDHVRIVALDAETFGHHNKEGVYMLEALLIELYERGHRVVSISDIVDSEEPLDIEEVIESTWSTNVMLYPMWKLPGNQIQELLWGLFDLVHSAYDKLALSEVDWFTSYATVENGEHLALWKVEELAELSPNYARKVKLNLQLMKMEQSDQFWWASGVAVMGERKFSHYMIESVLKYYLDVAEIINEESLIKQVATTTSDIQNLLRH